MRLIAGSSFLAGLSLLASPVVAFAQPPPPGMAAYYLALLEAPGTPMAGSSADHERAQAAHLARMAALNAQGILVGAGPIADGGDLRGVFILRAASMDEARRIVDDDAAVKAGFLRADLVEWWGPAGVGDEYASRHKQDPSRKDEMVTYQLALLSKGPKWTPEETPETQAIQKGHMDNIHAMASAGALVTAGPFLNGGDRRGLFVFRLPDIDAARGVAEKDPAVQAGRLVMTFATWYVAEGVFPQPKP